MRASSVPARSPPPELRLETTITTAIATATATTTMMTTPLSIADESRSSREESGGGTTAPAGGSREPLLASLEDDPHKVSFTCTEYTNVLLKRISHGLSTDRSHQTLPHLSVYNMRGLTAEAR